MPDIFPESKSITPSPTRKASGPIRSIQVLRALAALFVVAFHSTVLWHDKFSETAAPWQNGNAGVDIFFVISGFIMVVSSRRFLQQADGWWQFMKLRLIRIVPLYWLATALKLVMVLAMPAMALHTRPDPWNTVASFLFIPARDGAGQVRPVLDVGWTLSFEMLFYLTFACAVFFRLWPLRLVAPVMLALAFLSLVHPANAPAFISLASPLVLEFVFGAVAAEVCVSGALERLASPWMIIPAISGLLFAGIVPADGVWLRVAIWGGCRYGCLVGLRYGGALAGPAFASIFRVGRGGILFVVPDPWFCFAYHGTCDRSDASSRRDRGNRPRHALHDSEHRCCAYGL